MLVSKYPLTVRKGETLSSDEALLELIKISSIRGCEICAKRGNGEEYGKPQ